MFFRDSGLTQHSVLLQYHPCLIMRSKCLYIKCFDDVYFKTYCSTFFVNSILKFRVNYSIFKKITEYNVKTNLKKKDKKMRKQMNMPFLDHDKIYNETATEMSHF